MSTSQYSGRLVPQLIEMVDRKLKVCHLELKLELHQVSVTGVCGIDVPAGVGDSAANVPCGKTATTFCADCGTELCGTHARHTHSQTYCEGCSDWHEKYDLTPANDPTLHVHDWRGIDTGRMCAKCGEIQKQC